MRFDIVEATRKYYLSSLRALQGDRRQATIRTRNWLLTIRTRNKIRMDAIVTVSLMDWTRWEEGTGTDQPTRLIVGRHYKALAKESQPSPAE